MSSSKATDEDGFQVEDFKHVLHTLDCHMDDLFNHVVNSGFPKPWSHHIIHPIYKLIPSANPKN